MDVPLVLNMRLEVRGSGRDDPPMFHDQAGHDLFLSRAAWVEMGQPSKLIVAVKVTSG